VETLLSTAYLPPPMEDQSDHIELAFGRALRRLRTERGISQEQLAGASGLDRTFISLLERGLRQPSLTTLISLATTLEITLVKLAAEIETELRQSHVSSGRNRGLSGNIG